jgi:hypothetical protein
MVGFDVLTVVCKKMAVFCIVAPCSLVEVHSISEIFAFYQTIQHWQPQKKMKWQVL